MGATLSSDHVNYLIWRYLQERGYGRTAVQLMRDWGVEPQTLPFAPAVKPYTLISLLQDGLTYDELSSYAPPRDSTPQRVDRMPSESNDPGRRYTFVDRRKRQASETIEDAERELARKRPRLQTNGSHDVSTPEIPHARMGRRKSSAVNIHVPADVQVNGDPMTTDSTDSAVADVKNATPDGDIEMQIDEPEPAQLIPTLLLGSSIGVQSIVQAPTSFTVADISVPGTETINVSWGVSDPSTLVATGGGIWRSWAVSPSLGTDEGLPEPEFADLTSSTGLFFISATCRAPNDACVATAYEDECGSKLLLTNESTLGSGNFLTQPEEQSDSIDAAHRFLSTDTGTVLALRWNPSSSTLLAIIVHQAFNKVVVYKMPDCSTSDTVIGDFPAVDATWISDTHFLLCGERLLTLYIDTPNLLQLQSLDMAQSWEHIRWDSTTHLAACTAPTEGLLALLQISSLTSSTGTDNPLDADMSASETTALSITIKSTALQSGQITAVAWQPLNAHITTNTTTTPFPPPSTRLLATASTDGTIHVWNALAPTLQCLHTLLMGGAAPAMAMAFSPDGALIAAAGDGRLYVWRAEVEGKAVAAWEAEERERDWERTRLGNGDGEVGGVAMEGLVRQVEEVEGMPYHALAWDATGSRVAVARGERVSVVELALPG